MRIISILGRVVLTGLCILGIAAEAQEDGCDPDIEQCVTQPAVDICSSYGACLSEAKSHLVMNWHPADEFDPSGAGLVDEFGRPAIHPQGAYNECVISEIDPYRLGRIGVFVPFPLPYCKRPSRIGIPSNRAFSLGTPSVSANPGFSVLLITRVSNVQPQQPIVYLQMLTNDASNVLFSLGRAGANWAYGRHIHGSSQVTNSAYWQIPWEPTSRFENNWEAVFLTFTPDGKVRLDRFQPIPGSAFYADGEVYSSNTEHNWTETILDAGFPTLGYPTSQSTTTEPAPPAFYPVGPLRFGFDPALNPYPETQAGADLFASVQVFNAPLTKNQMIAYEDALVGYSAEVNMPIGLSFPCNTGAGLLHVGSVGAPWTPCGATSQGNPIDWTATGANSGYSAPVTPLPPRSIIGTTQNNSVTILWQPPVQYGNPLAMDTSVTDYIVTLGALAPVRVAASSACDSSGDCSYSISGAPTGVTANVSVIAENAKGASPPGVGVPVTPPGASGGGVLGVSASGNGAYPTIQSAINALPATGGPIYLQPGTYREVLNITKPNVRLIGGGASASDVVVTYDHYHGQVVSGFTYGTANSATVTVTGSNVTLSNLTVQNTADKELQAAAHGVLPAVGQAVALNVNADRFIGSNIRVLGGQDTLLVQGAGQRSYFQGCFIEGYVDYIFGDGKAAFDSCEIRSDLHGTISDEVTITAQSRQTSTADDGFVFYNSRLTFADQNMNNVYLGRPYVANTSQTTAYSKVIFLNTTITGSEIAPPRWIEFIPGTTNYLPTSYFAEYNSICVDSVTGVTAPCDLSGQEQHVVALGSADVAAYSPASYLAGSDAWNPTQVAIDSQGVSLTNQGAPVAQAPLPPVIVASNAGNGNVQVSWIPGAAYPPETGYVINVSTGGGLVATKRYPAGAPSGYVDGLTNGVTYTVNVSEESEAGLSPVSNSVTVTPVAGPPSAVHVSAVPGAASGSILVSFQIPTASPSVYDGGLHDGVYLNVYPSEEAFFAGQPFKTISNATGTPGTTSLTLNGATPGSSYYVSVQGYNGTYGPLTYPLAQVTLPPNSQPPLGYQLCAIGDQGQSCDFGGTSAVAYGANGVYLYGTFSGGVPCALSSFSTADPVPNVVKSCFVNRTPQVTLENQGDHGTALQETGNTYMGISGVYSDVVSPDGNGGIQGRWSLQPLGDGTYEIANSSGKGGLQITGNLYAGHTDVYYVADSPFSGATAQHRWKLIPAAAGIYNIISAANANEALQRTGDLYQGSTTIYNVVAAPLGLSPANQEWQIVPRPAPLGYSFCSIGDQAASYCPFTGTAMVAYGSGGSFVFQAATGGIACQSSSFGSDPSPGIVKNCYVNPSPIVTIENAGLAGSQLQQTGNAYMGLSNVFYDVDSPDGRGGTFSQWRLMPQGDGSFEIVNGSDNSLGLQVTGNAYMGNTNVFYAVDSPVTSAVAQHAWILKPADNGTYYLETQQNTSQVLQRTGNLYPGTSDVDYVVVSPLGTSKIDQEWRLSVPPQ